MPDLTFDSLEAVPEGLKEFAKKTDAGSFVVKVVPQVKLDEFRETNVTIAKERDALKLFREQMAPIVGENPSEFAARVAELTKLEQQVKDGALKGTDAISVEVQNRVAAMKSDFERQNGETAAQLAEARRREAAANDRYNRSIVDRAVTDAVVHESSGALPSALQDILLRARGVFTVDAAGKLVAKDGEAIIYGSDGASPMTPLEWMQKLRSQAPYFFKSSNGGGAAGGNGLGGEGFKGPLSKVDFDKLGPVERIAYARKHGMLKSRTLTGAGA
jgi:hypothetical protein